MTKAPLLARLPGILAVAAGLVSCAGMPPNEVLTAEYVCDDGRVVSAAFDNRGGPKATLDLGGARVELPIAVSASGARYSDGETTFWTKGDEALLESGGASVICRRAGGR